MRDKKNSELLAVYNQDQDQFRRLMEFYFEPLFYIHASHLEPLLGKLDILSFVYESRLLWDQINRLVCRHYKMDETDIFFPSEERHEMLFYSPSRLGMLSRAIGATLFHREIHRVVLKRPREELMRLLGPKLYHHALRRAMFFQPRFLPFDLIGVVGANLCERVLNAGKFCILACLSDLPETLKQRFKLKFPTDDEWLFPEFSKDLAVNDLWKFIRRLLKGVETAKGGINVGA